MGVTYNSNEIKLIELVQSLWQQKWLILLITAFGISASLMYILATKPVYEAKIIISPPSLQEIDGFNYGRLSSNDELLPPFTVENVYSIFKEQLLSESTKKTFLRHVFLTSLPKEMQKPTRQLRLYNQFSNVLLIKQLQKGPLTDYLVTVRDNDPIRATQWLKQYIELTNKKTVDEILHTIKIQKRNATHQLVEEMTVLREMSAAWRQEYLALLKEGRNIARDNNIGDQVLPSTDDILASLTDLNLIYLRGSKILTAEIRNLTERATDEPFIGEFRKIQGTINLYKKMTVPKNVAVSHLNDEITAPDLPATQTGWFILIRSAILAFVIAVILASFRYVLSIQNKSPTRN